MRRILPLLAVLPLSACGGGSGSDGPPTVPTLNVTLAPASQTIKAFEDASEATFSFDATQSGTTSDPVYPDVQYDKSLFALQGSPALAGGKYVVAFKTAKDLGGDSYKGNITFRLCRDTACATVYPGSTQTFAYTLDVQLKDWVALQRNPAHTGYVHATFDPASFKKAWDWTPDNTDTISSVATKGAVIFVSQTNQDRTHSIHALSSVTGAVNWQYNFGSVYDASAPSLAGDQIYVTTLTMSIGDSQNVVLNATTGQYIRAMPFAAQSSFAAAPTPFATELYMSAGYYGGVVYGYNAYTGSTLWTANGTSTGIWSGEAPAVDEKNVYYYSGSSIDVFDRMTGAKIKSMVDPFFVWGGYSYIGGPIIGSKNNILAYSGSYGGGGIGFEMGQPKPLVNYSLASGAYTWHTPNIYETVPAVAKGVVYVARNNPARLDAISEDSGTVLWSWTPPAGEQFLGNAIVTDTLVFVSTDKAVYAVSTTGTTHSSVWTAATPGGLAISSDNRLVIASRGVASSGAVLNKLTVYTLR